MSIPILVSIIAQVTSNEQELGYTNHSYIWFFVSALLIGTFCFGIAVLGRQVVVGLKRLNSRRNLPDNSNN